MPIGGNDGFNNEAPPFLSDDDAMVSVGANIVGACVTMERLKFSKTLPKKLIASDFNVGVLGAVLMF